jgi:hypothetical protein
VVILIAYVPFGVYNSGSAIRYASSFLLFLIFPSMLRSAMSAEDATDPNAFPTVPRARFVAFNRTLRSMHPTPLWASTRTVE